MLTTASVIAPYQLKEIHRQLSADICQTLAWLSQKLNFEFTMPWGRRGGSPREYAELREARSLVSAFKYPDHERGVRREEMAWALALVHSAYRHGGNHEGADLFAKAATLLNIDLAQAHEIPQDLDHKISNEMRLGQRTAAALALPAAA